MPVSSSASTPDRPLGDDLAALLDVWAAMEDATGHPASAAYARSLAARFREEDAAPAAGLNSTEKRRI